jgi:hypothetical protein
VSSSHAFAERFVRLVIGPEQARILFLFSPGGFEAFVRESSEPAAALTVPPPRRQAPELGRILTIARAHGADILAP